MGVCVWGVLTKFNDGRHYRNDGRHVRSIATAVCKFVYKEEKGLQGWLLFTLQTFRSKIAPRFSIQNKFTFPRHIQNIIKTN